jgi:hypothetical protein
MENFFSDHMGVLNWVKSGPLRKSTISHKILRLVAGTKLTVF